MSKEKDDDFLDEDWSEDDDDEGDDASDTEESDGLLSDGVTNSLELAEKTLKASEVVEKLPEILPETRIAFLTDGAAKEVKHAAKNYDGMRYIMKGLRLQKREDDKIVEKKKDLYKIKTKEQLKQYLQSINRSYLYTIIEDGGDIESVIASIQFVKPSGFSEDLQGITGDLVDVYDEYNQENKLTRQIDDSGMIAKIASEGTVSSGTHGNERLALVSTITATNNVDMKQQTKIKEAPSLVRSAKRAFDKFSR